MTIEEFKWAKDYFNYLEFKSKGLRSMALENLSEFIRVFKEQDQQERRKFIDAVKLEVFNTSDFNKYIPYDLSQAINDEIKNWQIEEPNSPTAFKWTYDSSDLMKSINLNPNDQITLEMLSSSIINRISMNQHELDAGFGYQGDPKEDLELINFLKPHLENLIDREKKIRLKRIVKDLEESAEKYLEDV